MNNIQFITHQTQRYSYADSAALALKGGCRWIQLRMKDIPDKEFIEVAAQVSALCHSCGAKFIIDDRVHLVKQVGAHGVHLGKNDMPISQAREILGPDIIIGGTANTFEDVLMHYHNGADYIGCGPFRFTLTKKNLSPVLGLEGYESIVKKMREANVSLPLIAIGGINYNDIPYILKTGVNGIALSGSVLQAQDPVEEMKKIMNLKIE